MRARQHTCTKLRKLSVSAGLKRSIGELNEAIATSRRSVEAEVMALSTASTQVQDIIRLSFQPCH